jgi:hypothetical protein
MTTTPNLRTGSPPVRRDFPTRGAAGGGPSMRHGLDITTQPASIDKSRGVR